MSIMHNYPTGYPQHHIRNFAKPLWYQRDRSRTLFDLVWKDLFDLFVNLNHTYKKNNKRITFIPSLEPIKKMRTMKKIYVTLVMITLISASYGQNCGYNGVWNGSSCDCDPGWTGSDCSELIILPANSNSGYRPGSTDAWGASVLKDDSGIYHMWVSVSRIQWLTETGDWFGRPENGVWKMGYSIMQINCPSCILLFSRK